MTRIIFVDIDFYPKDLYVIAYETTTMTETLYVNYMKDPEIVHYYLCFCNDFGICVSTTIVAEATWPRRSR